MDPREGLWMIKISNICLHQNSIFIKILKINEILSENPRIIFVLFYDVHKQNMFTINLENGREAPSKARKKGAKRLEFLVLYIVHSWYRVSVVQYKITYLDQCTVGTGYPCSLYSLY